MVVYFVAPIAMLHNIATYNVFATLGNPEAPQGVNIGHLKSHHVGYTVVHLYLESKLDLKWQHVHNF